MNEIKLYMRSDQIMERFADAVGKNNAGAYIQGALLAVAGNAALQKCVPQSIAMSALRAATLRLSCDPGIGEAYLVPFKDSCTLIIGYKGLKTMALRTGRYRILHVANVYEGEDVVEDRVRGTHEITGAKTGDLVIGRLAYFELNPSRGETFGFAKSLYMTTEEIHAHAKRFSRSYSFKGSVWQSYEPGEKNNPMEIKTPFRLLIQRWGFLDPQDRMMAHLNASEDVEEINGDYSEMPGPEEVTVKENGPKSKQDLLRELGFEEGGSNGQALREHNPDQPTMPGM